jgi:hypothetical protein
MAIAREPANSVFRNIAKKEILFSVKPDRAFGKLKSRGHTLDLRPGSKKTLKAVGSRS